jgi:hypothetical protein
LLSHRGTLHPLVPAEAGTQPLPNNVRQYLPPFFPRWIPAFAGMSGEKVVVA